MNHTEQEFPKGISTVKRDSHIYVMTLGQLSLYICVQQQVTN